MKNNAIINQEQESTSDEIFKLTALVYFQEALLKQEYESCQELVGFAKGFGAAQSEIDEVIISYLRGDKAGSLPVSQAGQNGANQTKNRLRSLKEEQ